MKPLAPSGSGTFHEPAPDRFAAELRLVQSADGSAETGQENIGDPKDFLLAKEKLQSVMQPARVLSVSYDPHLLESRSAILRTAGYAVVPALSIKEAIDCFKAGGFGLVLLGHSIPAQDRSRLACLVRASDSPAPIVFVTAQSHPAPDPLADATIESSPSKLLGGIKDAWSKRGNMPRETISPPLNSI